MIFFECCQISGLDDTMNQLAAALARRRLKHCIAHELLYWHWSCDFATRKAAAILKFICFSSNHADRTPSVLCLYTSPTWNAPYFTSRSHQDRTSAHAAPWGEPTAPQRLSHLTARSWGAVAGPHPATSGAGGTAAQLDSPRSALRSAADACRGGAGCGRGGASPFQAGPGSGAALRRRHRRSDGKGADAAAWLCAGAMVPPAGARLLPRPGRSPLLSILLLLLCSGGGCLPRRRPAGPPVVLGKSRAGARGGHGAVPCPCGCRGAQRARRRRVPLCWGTPLASALLRGGPWAGWGAAAACHRARCAQLKTTGLAHRAAQSVTGLCYRQGSPSSQQIAKPICLIGPTELNVSCSLCPLISVINKC